MNEITVAPESAIVIDQHLAFLAEMTKQKAENARAANTLDSYESDWDDFKDWCVQKNLSFLPADPCTVAVYLTDRSEHAWKGPSGRFRKVKEKQHLNMRTLERRKASIIYYHKKNALSFDSKHPTLVDLLKNLRKEKSIEERRKDPLLLQDIREMVKAIPETFTGIRDKVILLVGFVTALRRSEVETLSFENLKFVEEGIEVHLRKSKTGKRNPLIPYGSNPVNCPVRALKKWLTVSNITQGSLFRSIDRHGNLGEKSLSGQSIANIIKRNPYVREKIILAKIDSLKSVPDYSGHSLRAGFVTTAARAGIPEHLIMEQTGHKKSDTLKKYIRESNKWGNSAATKIGL